VKKSLIGWTSALLLATGCAHQSHSEPKSAAQEYTKSQAETGADASQQAQESGNAAASSAEHAAPDDTAINQRDREGATVLPLEQGEDAQDLAMTKQIRQAVIADDSLSFEAKNVKIVSQHGEVTLRGPVKSQDEKQIIQYAADRVAGPEHVQNQLEIDND